MKSPIWYISLKDYVWLGTIKAVVCNVWSSFIHVVIVSFSVSISDSIYLNFKLLSARLGSEIEIELPNPTFDSPCPSVCFRIAIPCP